MRAGHEPADEIDALDRELQLALRVEPSPALAARVRTEIASAPARTSGRFTWVHAVGMLAVAAAVVLAIAATLKPQVAKDVQPSTPLDASREASVAAATEPATSMGLPVVIPAGLQTGRPVQRAGSNEPPVQFSEADVEGLRHLVRLASQEDAGLADLLAQAEEPTANAGIAIREIQIVPLVIERLEPDAY